MNFLSTIIFKLNSLLGYEFGTEWAEELANSINSVIAPILILAASAGAIYAIVIGVKMAKANSEEQRTEAKKRLISVITAVAVVIVLIVFFTVFFGPLMDALLPSEAGGSNESGEAIINLLK